jgi:hypothetical protein
MIIRKTLRREPVNISIRDAHVSFLNDAEGVVQTPPRAATRQSATKETGRGAIKESWGWDGRSSGRAAYTEPASLEF